MAGSTQSHESRANQGARAATRGEMTSTDRPVELMEYLRDYARAKPEVCAMWCFGIGFVLGWKLKPW